MDKATNSNSELTAFERKLLGRVRAANERLSKTEDLEDLRSELTFRRVKIDFKPRSITSDEIKQVRKKLRASQAVFAMFIQVPLRTLQEWEQGRAEVSGIAARFIGEMLDNEVYWRARFLDSLKRETA